MNSKFYLLYNENIKKINNYKNNIKQIYKNEKKHSEKIQLVLKIQVKI